MISKSNDKVISGVIAGFAEHFHSDVRLLRIIALIFVIITGFFPGAFIYLVFALIMKKADDVKVIPIKEDDK